MNISSLENSPVNQQSQNFVEKKRISLRWVMVLLCSFGFFFGQYAFQDLATDQYYYKYQFKHLIKNFQFYFASINSFTLIFTSILAPLVGFGCDRYGTNIVLLGHQFLKMLSSFLQMISIIYSSPSLLFISRLVFNVMNGQTGILTAGIVAGNFQKNEMAFPNAIISMLTIIGSGANMICGPYLIENYNITSELFVCVLIQAIGFIFYLIIYNHKNYNSSTNNNNVNNHHQQQQELQLQSQQQQQIVQYNSSFSSIQYQGSQDDLENPQARTRFSTTDDLEAQQQNQEQQNQQQPYLQKIKNLSNNFWIACFIYASFNMVYSSVDNYGNIFIMQSWHLTPSQAAALESLFPFITFLLPFIGILVDKNSGKSFQILCFMMLSLMVSIMFMMYFSPGIGFLIFGASNALRLTLILPILSQVVGDRKMIPFANAIVKCMANFLGFFFQLAIGYSYLETQSYRFSMIMCFFFAFIGLLLALYLYAKQKQTDLTFIKSFMPQLNKQQQFVFPQKQQCQQKSQIVQ